MATNNSIMDLDIPSSLFQHFLLAYIKNLNFNEYMKNNKDDVLAEFYENLNTIINLYNNTPDKNNTIEELKTFFKTQVNIVLKNTQKLDTTTPVNKQLIYTYMHGGLIDETPYIVPYNIVLVFFTPLNNFGMIKNLKYYETLRSIFANESQRAELLANIFCSDKYQNDANSYINGQKHMLKYALVLYPQQLYFNLEIAHYKKEDKGHNMGIFLYHGKEEINTIKDLKTDYKNTLHGLISEISSTYHNKINYLFVDTCREFNSLQLSLEKAYVYENYAYYFNTIMNNCSHDKLSHLPKTYYNKSSSYEQILYNKILTTYFSEITTIIKNGFLRKFLLLIRKNFETDREIKVAIRRKIKIHINDSHIVPDYLKLYVFLALFINNNLIFCLLLYRCSKHKDIGAIENNANILKDCMAEANEIRRYFTLSQFFIYKKEYKIYKRTALFKELNAFCDKYENVDKFQEKLILEPSFLKSKLRSRRMGIRSRAEFPTIASLTKTRRRSDIANNTNNTNNIYNIIKGEDLFKDANNYLQISQISQI